MSGLVIREILSTPGQPLSVGGPAFPAYANLGQYVLKKQPKFRNELKAAANKLEFLAIRLRRNFNDTQDDADLPLRLIIQHTDPAGLPAMDVAADITNYHNSRTLEIHDEVDTPGAEKSHLVFPDMSGSNLPVDGNVRYLLQLFFMVVRKIDFDANPLDDMLRAYLGAMLLSKCR